MLQVYVQLQAGNVMVHTTYVQGPCNFCNPLVADNQSQTGVLATCFNLGRTCQHHHHWRDPLSDTHPVAVGYICLSTGAQEAYFHEHPDLGTANTGIRGQTSHTHTLQAMSLDPAVQHRTAHEPHSSVSVSTNY